MIKIIIMIFPAILSVAVSEKLEKKNYSLKEWIYNYAYYLIMNNLIISFILSTIFGGSSIFLLYNQYTNLVVVKYVIISLLLVLMIPFFTTILKNNFSFNVSTSKQKRSK